MQEHYSNMSKPKHAGMTFVEMFMAIAILAIGMEAFTLLFLRSWRINAFIMETGVAAATASRAVNQAVSELRKIRQGDNGDYPIESGDDFDLVVYVNADADSATERVHYYLQNGTFYRGITEPTATQPVTYPSGDQTVTTLAAAVANEASEPIFTYFNDDYPGDEVNNPLATPIAIRDARLVKVRLVVNLDPNNAPEDTNIESFAEFRNLNMYVQ